MRGEIFGGKGGINLHESELSRSISTILHEPEDGPTGTPKSYAPGPYSFSKTACFRRPHRTWKQSAGRR